MDSSQWTLAGELPNSSCPIQDYAGWPSPANPDDFRFDSDSVASSTSSTQDTSDDDALAFRDDWRHSAKFWTAHHWAIIADRYLYENGYALHTRSDFECTIRYEDDADAFFAQRLDALDDGLQWSGIRKAFDMRYPYMRSVYVRAAIVTPGSDEIKVTKLLSRQHRDAPFNFAVRTLDIFEFPHDGVDVYLLVQEDGGHPCYLFPQLFRDEQVWRRFVLDCFEGVAFMHALGIAHLDIAPCNVLYDQYKARPSFIDFEGCHYHEGEIQALPQVPAAPNNKREATVTRKHNAPTAINATLPELQDPNFDVFAADVWCLGSMLRDLRDFPDNDLRALFRFLCMKEPKARPTMQNALQTLKALLASDTDLLL